MKGALFVDGLGFPSKLSAEEQKIYFNGMELAYGYASFLAQKLSGEELLKELRCLSGVCHEKAA